MNPESINIHAWIIRQHGRDVLKATRKLENTSRKISAWQNHRHFNIRCVKNNITPPSVRLISNVNGTSADKILRKAEKQLMEVRIRTCKHNIDRLSQEKQDMESDIRSKIPVQDWQRIEAFIARAQADAHFVNKTRQRAKFEKLSRKSDAKDSLVVESDVESIQSRWVHNVSSKTLDKHAESLLKRGLNFAVTPKSLPTEDIIVATELACKNLDAEKSASLRCEVAKAVKRCKVCGFDAS